MKTLHSKILCGSFTFIAFGMIFCATALISRVSVYARASGCSSGVQNQCVYKCINRYPGGITPTTDTSQVSNCTSLSTESSNCNLAQDCPGANTNIDTQCIPNCGAKKGNFSTQYCARNTTSVSTATGTVLIYANYDGGAYGLAFYNVTTGQSVSITVNTSTYKTNPYNTNIKINQGDRYYVAVDADGRGTGWRAYDGGSSSFFTNARNNATSNNYQVISEESWADSLTCSTYDSYDFDDVPVTVVVKNTAPPCTAANVSLSTNSLYLGKQGTFTVNTSLLNSKGYYYKAAGNSYSPSITLTNALNGSACSPSNTVSSCYVQDRVNYNASLNYTTPVNWTNYYYICSDSGLTNCSSERCQTSTSVNINPYPAFMTTANGGMSYMTGVMKQSVFPDDNINPKIYFSSQLFATSAISLFGYTPTNNLSSLSKLIKYSDINNSNTFFADIRAGLVNNKEISVITKADVTYNDSDMAALTSDMINVVDVSGNLNIGISGNTGTISCYKPTVFLVSGNLVFNQQFQIASGKDTACMFIVANGTSINITQNPARIDAYIISQTLATTSSTTNIPGKLTIKGGVALQGSTQSINFAKNLNAAITNANSIQSRNPSETIQYEGARYIKLLGKYLQDPAEISIRESQYTKQ